MTKRDIQAQETKRKIIETASRLFWETGFEGVTVDSITQAAGVSKGNFYNHFKSKEDIEGLIIYQTFEDLYRKKIDFDASPVIESIGKWFDAIYSLIDRAGFSFMRYSWGKSPGAEAKKNGDSPAREGESEGGLYQQDTSIISNFLKAAVKAGELSRKTPVEPLALQIVASGYGLCMCAMLNDSVPLLKQGIDSYMITLDTVILKPYRRVRRKK
jgi:AcrR family transcriptional regulator